jgi:hypothetical protein
MDIALIILILALICFVVSAIGVAARVNLQSAGLALVVLAMLVGGATLP